MDPLGLPFEMYNHAGLFRTTELDKPVDTSGEIIDSGDPALDGPVKNALEMIERLSSNERVEQVFVRHAFRFWMGRNETLNDAPVLQAAHKAYQNSGKHGRPSCFLLRPTLSCTAKSSVRGKLVLLGAGYPSKKRVRFVFPYLQKLPNAEKMKVLVFWI